MGLQFTIAADGSVSNLELGAYPQTTLTSPRFADCFVAAIRTWRFPRPKGGGPVFVSYPWTFLRSSAARHALSSYVAMSEPEGEVTAAEREILERRKADVEVCYDGEPAYAEGKTTVLLGIEPDGSVGDVRLAGYPQTTLWSARIESCLLSRIRTWRFPPKDAGAIPVSLAFTLRARR